MPEYCHKRLSLIKARGVNLPGPWCEITIVNGLLQQLVYSYDKQCQQQLLQGETWPAASVTIGNQAPA